jgi:hypothetical protein
MRPIRVWRSRTPDGVRCTHFPSVVTTIMDQKVQIIKPSNLGELYTTLQNLKFVALLSRKIVHGPDNQLIYTVLSLFISVISMGSPMEKYSGATILLYEAVNAEHTHSKRLNVWRFLSYVNTQAETQHKDIIYTISVEL